MCGLCDPANIHSCTFRSSQMCPSSTPQRAVLLREATQLHKGSADATPSCHFLTARSLQSVGVMLTALWPRANKALYLEEIATSSCDLHKIEGSLTLTILTIEKQTRSDKRSSPPSIWSHYLKGTLRLSRWSWEP